MRTIKFRAWDKNKNRWCGLGLAGFVLIDENNKTQEGIQWSKKTEDQVLMQFTGLTDKNGKEIYEGDIVRAELYKKDMVFEIEWKSISEHSSFGAGTHNLTVIGNVWENPELLK